MIKEELILRSPVRAFMNSIHGGLKPGELGVIASPSGIGKTSVLVQIALDMLLQGGKVIHVSFTQHTDYVLAWYEDIFNEFIRKKNLENEQDVKNEIVKNRVLMKFSQGGISSEQILRSLRALIKDGGFNAGGIIIDGFDFAADSETNVSAKTHISAIKAFAAEMGVSVWYSCNIKDSEPFYDQLNDKRKIPFIIKDYADLFAVIIVLEPRQDHIAFIVSRSAAAYNSENLALKLDPKTMLILES
jgi:archaellum biogenesis ATPase FlaH